MNRNCLFVAFICWANVGFSQIKTVTLPILKQIINEQANDQVLVNFWATWCKPCVAELPELEKINADKNSKIKVLLVSMDFLSDGHKVEKMVTSKNLKSEVLLMNAPDQNQFIDQVSKNWSGAIPASWFINKKTGKKFLIEKALNESQIRAEFEKLN